MKLSHILIICFCFCFSSPSFSQKIKGKVIDAETNEPLIGAAVYYDNTSIGTSTDEKGEFSLPYKKNLKTSLVFSFLGYKSFSLIKYRKNEFLEIPLIRNQESLDEIIISSKGWTREMMLKEFKKHYFGETINGFNCQLLNPEVLKLRYSSKEKVLTASSKAPLIFKNIKLKYLITSSLEVFEIHYSYVSKSKKRRNLNYVHYLGSNFYKTMQSNPTSKTKETRKETYKGSVLHFMRAIANKTLKKDGYTVFIAGAPVASGRYIKSYKDDASEYIKVKLKMPLTVRYKNAFISQVKSMTEYFTIDSFGNHAPTELVRFGGVFGKQRMGDSLPLDYLHKKQN
jgi:hypothetical protein